MTAKAQRDYYAMPPAAEALAARVDIIADSIPKGSVATYGQVAAAAGYPFYHRAVARFLRTAPTSQLPWQRVIGAGGEIKLRQEAGAEQRLRLRMEGIAFRGRLVDIEKHQHTFRTWELD